MSIARVGLDPLGRRTRRPSLRGVSGRADAPTMRTGFSRVCPVKRRMTSSRARAPSRAPRSSSSKSLRHAIAPLTADIPRTPTASSPGSSG